jgi:hypothetical protein
MTPGTFDFAPKIDMGIFPHRLEERAARAKRSGVSGRETPEISIGTS